MNEDKLQKIVEKTRSIIIELYVKCEMDYVDNLKVYEAIVESKILETTKKQIENLEKKANTMVSETNKKIVASDEIKPIGPLPPPPPALPQVVDPAAVVVPRNLPLMPPQVAAGITI